MDEYRESVLKAIRDYEKQFHHVDQYEIANAIAELYEIIRAIPTMSTQATSAIST